MYQKFSLECLQIKDLWKIFDEQIIFSDLNESIYRGERVAITGGNGVGKTTLLKIILGEESFDEGEVRVGESVEIGYLSYCLGGRIKFNPFVPYGGSHKPRGYNRNGITNF